MRRQLGIVFALIVVTSVSGWGQMMKRTDALWARTVPPGTVTIDGLLNEAAWAVAESVLVRYGPVNTTVIPGSGWKTERSGGSWNGVVTDPTYATLKFLVQGNELVFGVFVRDSSVGGGLFNECDGLLMNMRDHSSGQSPAGPHEFGYMWVNETWGDPNAGNPGAPPAYFGPSKDDRADYSGATHVFGLSSDDKNGTSVLTPDGGYSMEVRFALDTLGYDVTKAEGDIVEFTCSVYDADWEWPYNDSRFYGNRAWWQGQWGNSDTWNVGRISARPDVTLNTNPLPEIGADLVIPNGVNHPSPVIDGVLNEGVWARAASFRVTFNDTILRKSYAGVGRWRSGQTQPKLSGATGTPPVLDPGDAVFKYFFKEDTLYFGIDVNDQVVTSNTDYDRWDGARITMGTRDSLETIDHVLLNRLLDVRFNPTGGVITANYLHYLDSLHLARVAVAMKSGTTINDPNDIDAGYTIEMAVRLAPFGYPVGRGDGVVFLGATLFDGDAFTNAADDYGTRTWFWREHNRSSAPAWGYLDPSVLVTGIEESSPASVPREFLIVGNYPNPFNPTTTIRYQTPTSGAVTLRVFDLLGRLVREVNAGVQTAGTHDLAFSGASLGSGVYFYHMTLTDAKTGAVSRTRAVKMSLLK
jgi:hypothetical protein